MMNSGKRCVRIWVDYRRFPEQKSSIRIFPPVDPMRMQLEIQLRAAIREAVNRSSRKPFLWGGLKGYEQWKACPALKDLPVTPLLTNNPYLGLLRSRVEWVLAKNHTAAEDLKQAYQLLLAVARCFHYPPPDLTAEADPKPSRLTVAEEMTRIIQQTQPTGRSNTLNSAYWGNSNAVGNCLERNSYTVTAILASLKII